MPDLTWYIKRLRAMSPEEVIQRLQMALQKGLWKQQLQANAHKPKYSFHWAKPTPYLIDLSDLKDTEEAQELLQEADAYMQHQWPFGVEGALQEDYIDWHTDPASGIQAPIKFGFDIDHRNEDLVGNIKITWEKSGIII